MEYIASVSYGKDSLAMLEILKEYGEPLDRIVHAEVMATPTIPADLPPMMGFKAKADKIIKQRYGIEVEHLHSKKSYEEQFYTLRKNKATGKNIIYGFPIVRGAWCNSELKVSVLNKIAKKDDVRYIGIACDEPNRFHILTDNKRSPLVEHGISEAEARKICERLDLLSPIYSQSARGGCWFCHNQGIQQLRLLRKQHPEYWKLLLKWDKDSDLTFHPDGHTVHDFDERFRLEDAKLLSSDETFRWDMLTSPLQFRMF